MSSLPPCPYTALGVSKDAQLAEIRTAYRKLVLKCHPDKVQDPELKAEKQAEFQKVQQAYELLTDENERSKYDDQVKLVELQKKKRAAEAAATSSSPRTPTQYFNIRTTESRPDSFKTKSSSRASPAMGAAGYQSRSYEDDLTSARFFEDAIRSARRQASYDDKRTRRDGDRDRDRDRERERERERERGRERERERERRRRKEEQEEKERVRAAEKEARRADKKRLEKERKREADEKRRHKSPYVEPYDDDEYRISKSERKKSTSSTSKKHDDREHHTHPANQEEDANSTMDKTTQDILNAVEYMVRKKAQPSLNRAQTFSEPPYHVRYAEPPPIAVPTPPAVQDSPFSPPPIAVDEDAPRRSSAKTSARRSSDTPKTRDRSTHKKSSSGSKDSSIPTTPIIIDSASPRIPPQFLKAGTTPPAVPESPPRKSHLARANTMTEDYGRTPPAASLSRSQTYHYMGDPDARMPDPRGRSRSRLHPQVVVSDDSDSEDEHERRARRRDRRHKTHSPPPMPADYPPVPSRHSTRYTVTNGRTAPIPADRAYYRDESPPPSRKSKSGYYSSSHPRQTMPSREDLYSSSGASYYGKVKTSKAYAQEDVQYSDIPHTSYWAESYARA